MFINNNQIKLYNKKINKIIWVFCSLYTFSLTFLSNEFQYEFLQYIKSLRNKLNLKYIILSHIYNYDDLKLN